MAERKKVVVRWSRFKRALKAAAVAEKGQVACLDTADGALVAAGVATTLVPIGLFEDSFTGNGTRQAAVELFSEVDLTGLPLSATTPPVDADVGKVVYLRGDGISTTSAGSSAVGRLWAVKNSLAYVQALISGGAIS